MAPAPPTRREVLIVAILLAVITFFASHEPPPSIEVGDTLSSWGGPHQLESHKPRPIDSVITWGPSRPPETTIVAHVPGLSLPSFECCHVFLIFFAIGWTLFEKLYVFKGVIYIITDYPSNVPDIQFISSKGVPIRQGKEESRLPTPNDIQVISTKSAKRLFNAKGAQVIDGFSVRLIS